MKIALIGIFGVLGVMARFYLGNVITKSISSDYPFGTFVINMLGAFLIGVIYVIGTERLFLPDDIRLGLMIGFLGGFTTFSAYCIEVARLIEDARYFYAILYFGLSPILGVIAVFSGLALTRFLLGTKVL